MGKYSIGAIWGVPDSLWVRAIKWGKYFAWNKSGHHPSVIKRANPDNFTYQLAPGTSKRNLGSCVFRTRITSERESYFLLNLSIPMTESEFDNFQKGWNQIERLSEEEIEKLLLQVKMCHGKF